MDHPTDVRLERIHQLLENQEEELNQYDLATALNMTQSAVNQYLHGRIPLNTDIIIKFAKVLQVIPSAIDRSLNWEK